MGTGNACVKQQTKQPELKYPILLKIMHPLPSRQFPLEKPFYHSGMVDDNYEINYLEIVLSTADIKKKQDNLTKQEITEQSPQQQTAVQITLLEKNKKTPSRRQSQDKPFNEKLRRSITANNTPDQVSQEECSVLLKKNQIGSDTQTVKSILKTNRTKSSKSAPKVTNPGSLKKVSFNPQTLKKKNKNFLM